MKKLQKIKFELENSIAERQALLDSGNAVRPDILKELIYEDKRLLDLVNSVDREPTFQVGDMVISTRNTHLTYQILEVGLLNERGNLDYKVEIFTDGVPGIKTGFTKKPNICLIECSKMDEWGVLLIK